MTDRELLEAAAKAAGLYSQGDEISRYGHFMGLSIREDNNPSGYCWNPLTNEGDAFRLAHKLKLDVFFHERGALVNADDGFSRDERGPDPLAAARRAIVRAAAETKE